MDIRRSEPGSRPHYDRLSGWYDLLAAAWERPVVKRGLSLLAPRQGERLLEIGPGTGWALTQMAASVGPTGLVDAIELSPRMLRAAQARVDKAGLGQHARLWLGDASQLPYADGGFDGAFMSFVLESMGERLPLVLAEIRRTLAPEGRLVVVALSTKRDSLVRRLYERGHRRFPRLLDCRPIDVEGTIRESGLEVRSAGLASVGGLPVQIVLACEPGAGAGRGSPAAMGGVT